MEISYQIYASMLGVSGRSHVETAHRIASTHRRNSISDRFGKKNSHAKPFNCHMGHDQKGNVAWDSDDDVIGTQ